MTVWVEYSCSNCWHLIGPSRGVNIGSEMSGGVYNITIRNVHFHAAKFAVRVKSGRERGGEVRDVTAENLCFDKMEMGVMINMHYGDGEAAGPNDEGTPHVHDITLRNISGNALDAGFFECLPESTCHNIALDNVNITYKGGFQCYHASGITNGVVIPDACF